MSDTGEGREGPNLVIFGVIYFLHDVTAIGLRLKIVGVFLLGLAWGYELMGVLIQLPSHVMGRAIGIACDSYDILT